MSKSVDSRSTATRKRKLPRLNEDDLDEDDVRHTDSDDMTALELPPAPSRRNASNTPLSLVSFTSVSNASRQRKNAAAVGPSQPSRKLASARVSTVITSSRGEVITLGPTDEEPTQSQEPEPLQPNTLPLAAWFYGREEHIPIIDKERFDGWLVWSDYAMTVQRTPDLIGTSRAPVLVWKLSDIDFVKATVPANGTNLILAIALRKDKVASFTTRWFDPAENDVLLFKLNDSIPGCLNAFTALVNALISGTRGKLTIIS
ncbi:hypothetical protein FRB90_000536, partial [Tulasnella sp. 427]